MAKETVVYMFGESSLSAMKVNLSAQIMSHTVAASLKAPVATGPLHSML